MKAMVLAMALLAVPACAEITSMPLTTTDKTMIGQPILAPDHPTVIAYVVTFQPGDKTNAHKHPWPHYGYMLEGTLTITNTETGKSYELKPGEFLVEMQNATHIGENRGNVPVKILIIDSVPPGVTSNTVAVP